MVDLLYSPALKRAFPSMANQYLAPTGLLLLFN